MKIKKQYSYTNKRQIWRLLPTGTGKLLIEDRNINSKDVYFNCLDLNSGKKMFQNFQLEEKSWVGIEAVHKDIIFFHKYVKPDMPGHTGIIAFDITGKNVIWSTDDYVFLFILNDKLYCYKPSFEGRKFFILDYNTGELLNELGDEAEAINEKRNESLNDKQFKNYSFPEPFNANDQKDLEISKIFQNVRENHLISGQIEHVKKNGLLFFNYHEVNDNGSFKNIFNVIEILSGLTIFDLVLDKETRVLIPDSFFILNNLIFLLKEKTNLIVCSMG